MKIRNYGNLYFPASQPLPLYICNQGFTYMYDKILSKKICCVFSYVTSPPILHVFISLILLVSWYKQYSSSRDKSQCMHCSSRTVVSLRVKTVMLYVKQNAG